MSSLRNESARQYFLEKYCASDRDGEFPQDVRSQALATFPPRELQYSNDVLTERIMRELSDLNRGWVQDFFDRVYIGKLRSFDLEAYAIPEQRCGEGFLVIFNVGCSLASHFWVDCFLKYVSDFAELYDPDGNSSHDGFVDDVVDVFSKWREADGHISLVDTVGVYERHQMDLTGSAPHAVAMAVDADRFLVSHELAHHIVGDTNVSYIRSQDIDKLIESFRLSTLSRGADREHIADGLAFSLLLGTPDLLDAPPVNIMRAGVGSMVMLSALAGLDHDPYHSSSPHYPAVNTRFDNAMAYMSASSISSAMFAGTDESYAFARMTKQLKKQMRDFHDVMNGRRIKRGLINV